EAPLSPDAARINTKAEANTEAENSRGAAELKLPPPAIEARDSLSFSQPPDPAAAFAPNSMARAQSPVSVDKSTQESLAANQTKMRSSIASDASALDISLGDGGGEGAAMRPAMEAGVFGRDNPDGASTKVRLAHSAGWSADDIEAALERLAPLLNLQTTQSTDPAIADFVASIPIAIVSTSPPAAGATSLGNMLQQQAVPLVEVVPADSRPLTWQAPFAQALVDESSTVALFVLRDEAEQILQVAQQAGELVNNPVWISSANGPSTPPSPKQQVVLLFAPQ
ncbi:MAG: hypothetical protein ABI557_12660, partial [Aureliella sp.]